MAEQVEVKSANGASTKDEANTPSRAMAARRAGGDMLEAFQSEMEDLWNRFWPGAEARRWFGRASAPLMARLGAGPNTWSMATDVFEKDGRLWVKADLPGMDKSNVNVALENGDLVVSGQREEEHKAEEGGWYRSERTFGSFYRRVPLPFPVKPEDVSAKFDNGVLEVSVPVPPEATRTGPTTIAVK